MMLPPKVSRSTIAAQSLGSVKVLVQPENDSDVYLCGSPRMADAVRDSLREAGLPAGCLHEERFAF